MKLYNTLTRKKEEFIPLVPGEVKIYNCGPTVYNLIHVGNARPLVIFDTLRRYFIYKGYDVKFAFNFTDIDDKIINKANDEGITSKELSEIYIEEFLKDAKGLNLYEYETINPKATEYIKQMIGFIEILIDKKAAYVRNGDVYFSIDSDEDYGKLSSRNVEDLMSGARVDVNLEKQNPIDFVLWKKKKEGEPYWDSPWGEGRPGWHIECSVMARALFGDTIDIHSGGEDLIFPHHENEIAQSETLTGKPFANYWLHNGMINVDNVKMSKSLGNFFLVRESAKNFDLEVLRFFLLSAHYRSPINYSYDTMMQSKTALERLYNGKKNMEFLSGKSSIEELQAEENEMLNSIAKIKEEFISAMDDDLNTADAIASMFDIVRFANTNYSEKTSKFLIDKTHDTLMEFAKVLGILSKKEELLDEEITELIAKRNQARKDKNFQLSDDIRDELKEKGVVLEDTRDGVKWKRI